MKKIFFVLFLTVLVFSKDNFIYSVDNKELNERIAKIEKDLSALKSKSKAIDDIANDTKKNSELIKTHSIKIAESKTTNDQNSKQISNIADSLASIKEILKDSTKNINTAPMPTKEIEVKIDTDSLYAKKEELERQTIVIETINDRVSMLEKRIAQINEEQNELSNTGERPIYEYFEYFVIISVALFSLMFLIIFILTARIKFIQKKIANLKSPV